MVENNMFRCRRSKRNHAVSFVEAKPLWVSGPKSKSRRGSGRLDCGGKAFVAVLGLNPKSKQQTWLWET